MNRDRWRSFLLLFIPAIIFLCATTGNLHLPGIQYDEVYYAPPAAALLKGQYEMDYVKIDPSVIHLFGRPIPLMFNYYTSFLRTYLTFPVFACFGISVYTIRGSSIAFGVIALIFYVAFARRLAGNWWIAFTTGLFLALDPGFVEYTHNDYVAVSTMMAWKGIGLWALLRWWQKSAGVKWLYLSAFVIGLGISDRASFLWIPMALAPTLLLVCGRNAWREIRTRMPERTTPVLASVAFVLGASLFLAFNLATLGGTFSPMASNFRDTSGGANNADFVGNLHLRLQMLTDVLSGGYLQHFILGENSYQTSQWHFSGSPLSWLVPLAFIVFSVQSIRAVLSGRSVNRMILFLLSMIACLLLFTCFTPTLFRGHQLLMLYPFPHLLTALLLFHAIQWTQVRWPLVSRKMIVAGVLLMVILLGMEALPVIRYHEMLQETGGRGVWSDATSEIVAEADRHPERTIVCMDWGFNAPLLCLTRLPVKTIRNYETTRRTPQDLAQLFDSTHVFLLHAPEYSYVPGAREEFFAALEQTSARVESVRVFRQREGQPVAYLVRAIRDSRSR